MQDEEKKIKRLLII